MKINKISIILIVSLALNLGFIISFYVIKSHKTNYHYRTNELNIELNESQKSEINKILNEFKINYYEKKQEILSKRIDIMEELGKPDYSMKSIDEILNELNTTENDLNKEFINTIIKICNILDNKQKIEFLYRLSKNWYFLSNIKLKTE